MLPMPEPMVFMAMPTPIKPVIAPPSFAAAAPMASPKCSVMKPLRIASFEPREAALCKSAIFFSISSGKVMELQPKLTIFKPRRLVHFSVSSSSSAAHTSFV